MDGTIIDVISAVWKEKMNEKRGNEGGEVHSNMLNERHKFNEEEEKTKKNSEEPFEDSESEGEEICRNILREIGISSIKSPILEIEVPLLNEFSGAQLKDDTKSNQSKEFNNDSVIVLDYKDEILFSNLEENRGPDKCESNKPEYLWGDLDDGKTEEYTNDLLSFAWDNEINAIRNRKMMLDMVFEELNAPGHAEKNNVDHSKPLIQQAQESIENDYAMNFDFDYYGKNHHNMEINTQDDENETYSVSSDWSWCSDFEDNMMVSERTHQKP